HVSIVQDSLPPVTRFKSRENHDDAPALALLQPLDAGQHGRDELTEGRFHEQEWHVGYGTCPALSELLGQLLVVEYVHGCHHAGDLAGHTDGTDGDLVNFVDRNDYVI